MNKYFLVGLMILFIICISGETTAQNSKTSGLKKAKFRLLNMHYENSNGEKGVTTYEYNNDGVVYKALWHLLDGKRSSINYHIYDENGNLNKIHWNFSFDGTQTYLFEYQKVTKG